MIMENGEICGGQIKKAVEGCLQFKIVFYFQMEWYLIVSFIHPSY